MRSVSFSLVGPSPSDVVACLHRHGFHPIDSTTAGRIQLRHPTVDGLYVSCGDYLDEDWLGLPDEFQELQQAIGGLTPTTHINVGVSGNIAGDWEARWLARCLLQEYPGFAFDEYLGYAHAWTLAEINRDEKFDGLDFFDYQGFFERTKASSERAASADSREHHCHIRQMSPPYHMSCVEQHALLYQLPDGRFQVLDKRGLAPVMTGYDYALVEQALAEYFAGLELPGLEIVDAVIYEPRAKRESRMHRQLRIHQRFSSRTIRDLSLDEERILLMDGRYVFVSAPLKQRLESSPFKYLSFTEGLRGFGGRRT